MNQEQFNDLMGILHAILQTLTTQHASESHATSFDVYPLTPSPDQMLAQLQATERELTAEQSRRREVLAHVANVITVITPNNELQEKSYKILLQWIATI